jgi:hypothetical protein
MPQAEIRVDLGAIRTNIVTQVVSAGIAHADEGGHMTDDAIASAEEAA